MCAAKHHVCFTSKADSALGHVCFAPKADIPVVQAYRADLAGEVFYKPTPYWPVSSVSFCALVKQHVAAISKISERSAWQ
jgi:hypothetical protein